MIANFYQGNSAGEIFLWKETDAIFSIAITIGEEEKFVVEITNGCSEIKVTKNLLAGG